MRNVLLLFLVLSSNISRAASEIGFIEEAVAAALANEEPKYLEDLMKEFMRQVYQVTLEENFVGHSKKQLALYLAIAGLLSDAFLAAEDVAGAWGILSKTKAKGSAWNAARKALLKLPLDTEGLVYWTELTSYAQTYADNACKAYIVDASETPTLEQTEAILFRVSELKILQQLVTNKEMLRRAYGIASSVFLSRWNSPNPFENKQTLEYFEAVQFAHLEGSPFLSWFNVFKILVLGNVPGTKVQRKQRVFSY